MNKNLANGPEIPMGLGMALAKSPDAMRVFASMPPARQQALIEQTHQIRSKQEMNALVQRMMRGKHRVDLQERGRGSRPLSFYGASFIRRVSRSRFSTVSLPKKCSIFSTSSNSLCGPFRVLRKS